MRFADAGGVALGEDFSVYVADTFNDTVRRFSAFGRELEQFGAAPERPRGAVSRDRTGVFDRPIDVAVADGVLFVGCGEGKLVRGVQRVDLSSGRVLAPLRAFGDAERKFGAPRGLTVTQDGLWVADTMQGVIQRFRTDGRFVCEIPVSLRPDALVARPVAVLPLSSAGGQASPELLVADQGDDRELRWIGPTGKPDAVPGAERFDEPTDLARDAHGRIYVLDRHGERVQRLHPDLSFDQVVVDLAEIGVD